MNILPTISNVNYNYQLQIQQPEQQTSSEQQNTAMIIVQWPQELESWVKKNSFKIIWNTIFAQIRIEN